METFIIYTIAVLYFLFSAITCFAYNYQGSEGKMKSTIWRTLITIIPFLVIIPVIGGMLFAIKLFQTSINVEKDEEVDDGSRS